MRSKGNQGRGVTACGATACVRCSAARLIVIVQISGEGEWNRGEGACDRSDNCEGGNVFKSFAIVIQETKAGIVCVTCVASLSTFSDLVVQ